MTEVLTNLIWDGATNTWNEVELTEQELAQREIDIANAQALQEERLAAEEALAALKASARAKLVAGEPLTEEEAATLVI
jgi:hypothetical protein